MGEPTRTDRAQAGADAGELRALLDACMLTHRRRFARALREFESGPAPKGGGAGGHATGRKGRRRIDVERLRADMLESAAQRRRRVQRAPRPTYPPELPVVERRDEIIEAIKDNRVVVICGETGSGKSTQLPKLCLDAGLGSGGMIGHTQPRRIAARSVAERVAEELGSTIGGAVGYKVRFGDRTSPDTYIKVMTDGILLAETQSDRRLEQYDTIIIDEAHERSLNIDFLLGYLKRLLDRRDDLKIIVTSATIDPQRFADHFAINGEPAPIIEVSGRTYPVEVRYRPLSSDEAGDEDIDQVEGVLQGVDELARAIPGDVLVFLPGEREIRETAEALRNHHPPETEILPLFARLSAAEQHRVFESHPGRRIVLATNVAETSLTVPGIRSVIDTGVARMSRYNPRSGVQRLPVEPVSQASSNQRSGRCGRVGPGVCIRLFSQEDYESREAFTPPEILRSNLAGVILQMKSLRLGELSDFPFIDAPRPEMVRDGYHTLWELGAIDADGPSGGLTPVGQDLARLPIDPRIGRMIVEGQREGCVEEVLVVAAALSIQDPRERPTEKRGLADEAHKQFADPNSDFLGYLNLWEFWTTQRRKLSWSKLRKACRQNFLSFARMREWDEVHRQLRRLVRERGAAASGGKADDDEDRYDRIHRALLAGLLGHAASRKDPSARPVKADGSKPAPAPRTGFSYEGVRGRQVFIFPGSGLFETKPKWMISAEVVETTRPYARTVARVQPEWIESVGKHLLARSYSDPRWDPEGQRVVAEETVRMMGLIVVPQRTVGYAKIDQAKARSVFIHNALVEEELRTKRRFMKVNRRLVEDARALEAKARSADILADAARRFAFYDQRIPADVSSGRALDRWLSRVEQDDPDILVMSPEHVMAREATEAGPERFPDEVTLAETPTRVRYRFEPGHVADGATLSVARDALPEVDERRAGWLIPGLLRARLIELIRGLPKNVRTAFVPAPDSADACMAELEERGDDGEAFEEAAARALERLKGVRIPREHWRLDSVPDHLRINWRVVDEKGKAVRTGRDLEAIREELGVRVEKSLRAHTKTPWSRTGIRVWDFGLIPERVSATLDGSEIPAFPGVVDEGDSVALRLFDQRGVAERETRRGVRRLMAIDAGRELRSQLEHLPGVDRCAMLHAGLNPTRSFKDELTLLVVERVFIGRDVPRTPEDFEARLIAGWGDVGNACHDTLAEVEPVLAQAHQVLVRLAETPETDPTVADIRAQLDALRPADLSDAPAGRLRHYPRYLAAINARLDRLIRGGAQARTKDAQLARPVVACFKAYLDKLEDHRSRGIDDEQLEAFRWLVEEYRVSVFAQELGTAQPVSIKRLEKQWSKVRA